MPVTVPLLTSSAAVEFQGGAAEQIDRTAGVNRGSAAAAADEVSELVIDSAAVVDGDDAIISHVVGIERAIDVDHSGNGVDSPVERERGIVGERAAVGEIDELCSCHSAQCWCC